MATGLGTFVKSVITSDKALSLVESMAAPHAVDRYTELVAPMVTARELRAEVTHVHRSTGTSITLTLRPTRQWRGFSAGQFVRIGVLVDGVRHTRCFSPCNSEHRADGRVELTVKAHGNSLVSRELYRNARPGLIVDLEQAAGEFRLPAPRPRDVVLISGGSGITPVLAMLRTLADEQRAGTWHGRAALLHYVRGPEDLVHGAELQRLGEASGIDVGLCFTRGSAEPHRGPDARFRGHFRAAHLDALAPWAGEAETFLCGPEPLMDAVREVYAARGVAGALHTEEFTAAPALLPGPDAEATGRLTFSASGADAENDGRVILEQAESAGLSPDYGCRMGICFTCTAVRRSGCTRNLVTGEADAEPDQPIQLCVNAPVGDVDIDI